MYILFLIEYDGCERTVKRKDGFYSDCQKIYYSYQELIVVTNLP